MKKVSKFISIKNAAKRSYKRLKSIPGVKEVGYGFKYRKGKRTKIPSIIVSVGLKRNIQDIPKAERIPKKINGIYVDVIHMNSWEQQFENPYEIRNPLVGGLSISEGRFTGSGGTMGAIVFENSTQEPMGLTNHHVLFHNRILKKSRIGDPITQPAFVKPTSRTVIGKLARGNERYDCAVFYLNSNRDFDSSLNGIDGRIEGTIQAEPNLKVKKTGARTRVTHGIVEHIYPDFFTIIPNPDIPAPNNEISDHGDSGAIWITDDGRNLAVGLHNRGETVSDPNQEWAAAIKVQAVLRVMDVHF